MLRALQDDGVAIVFISHKLNEVLEIADRVTVLRRGKKIDTVPTEGATEESLARLMVGRDVLLQVDKPRRSPREPVLEVEDLRVLDDRGLEAVRGLSMEVRGGRDRRAGRRRRQRPEELVEAIAGLRAPESGRVVVAGEDVTGRGVRADRPTPASPTSPRTASCAGSCSTSRSPRTSRCASTAQPPLEARLALVGACAGARASCSREYDVRGGDAELPRRRCRAATSRRSASRARSPPTRAADRPPADPRARRRRDRVRPPAARVASATAAAASCSCRSSSRRCARWRTASS